MPSHIFKEGLRLNQNVYQNVLMTLVKSWIEEFAARKPCSNKLNTSSYDQNNLEVVDYNRLMCGAWLIGSLIRPPETIKVKQGKKICQVLQDLSPEVIKCARSSFRGRLEAVINAEGGFLAMSS